jgi:hypothetical protein
MNQAVQVYDDATARDAALPSPLQGQLVYLKDIDRVQRFTGSAFVDVAPVVAGLGPNVVSTTKTDTFTTSSTSFVDVTGFSVTITPTLSNSKILVLYSATVGSRQDTTRAQLRLLRDSTAIYIGDSAGSRQQVSSETISPLAAVAGAVSGVFLDSPNSTSAQTYKLQMRAESANVVSFNRSVTDTDSAITGRAASTITVLEVAG